MSIVNGSLSLVQGLMVTVTSDVSLNNTAADLGLYINGSNFANAANILDFTQWGSGGNGRESVAVTKGIWTVNTFISAAPPYQYTGDGSQNGATFWDTVLGIEDFKNLNTFSIFPNPTSSVLNLQLAPSFVNGSINIFDILGKQVLTQEITTNNRAQLNVSNISKGLYLIKVSSEGNTQTKRFVKQ